MVMSVIVTILILNDIIIFTPRNPWFSMTPTCTAKPIILGWTYPVWLFLMWLFWPHIYRCWVQCFEYSPCGLVLKMNPSQGEALNILAPLYLHGLSHSLNFTALPTGSSLLNMAHENEIRPKSCPFLFKWVISTVMQMTRSCEHQPHRWGLPVQFSWGRRAEGETSAKWCYSELIFLPFYLKFLFNIHP